MKNPAPFPQAAASTNSTIPIGVAAAPLARPTARHGRRPRLRRRVSIIGAAFVALCAISGLLAGFSVAWVTRSPAPAERAAPVGSRHQQPPPPLPALPSTARAVLTYSGQPATVRALAWSPEGTRLASGGLDGRVMIWDLAGRTQVQFQAAGTVRALAFSPDGSLLAIGSGTQLTFVRAASGTVVAAFPHAHEGDVTGLAWSRSGPSRLVSTGLDHRAIVWDGVALAPLLTFTAHAAPIEAVTWASDGATLASSSTGGVVRVWRASDGREVHGYSLVPTTALRAAAFAPSGQLLGVGGDDGIVRLWNGLTCAHEVATASGTQCQDPPASFHAHSGPVRALAWAPDGRMLLASGGDDGVLALWAPLLRADAPLLTLKQPHPVLALAWSPDGRLIAAATGSQVTLWLPQ
jgi:WD40 repeat protein